MKIWVLELHDPAAIGQVGPATIGAFDTVMGAIAMAVDYSGDIEVPSPPAHEREWPRVLPRTEDSGFYWYESPQQHNCRAWFITSHEVR